MNCITGRATILPMNFTGWKSGHCFGFAGIGGMQSSTAIGCRHAMLDADHGRHLDTRCLQFNGSGGRGEKPPVDLEWSRRVNREPREIGVLRIDEIVGLLGNDDRGHSHQSGFAGIQPSLAELPQPRGWRCTSPVVGQVGYRGGGHGNGLRNIDGSDTMRRHHGRIDVDERLEHRKGDGARGMNDGIANGHPPSANPTRAFTGKCSGDASRRGETIDAHEAICPSRR